MALKKKELKARPKQKTDTVNTDKRRLRRFLFFWLPIIVCILGFIYVASFDPVRASSIKQIKGTITEVGQSPTGEIQGGPYTVKLADGRTITLSVFEEDALKAGTVLVVEEKETTLFKRNIYRFVRVIR